MADPKPENNVQHFLAKIAGVDVSTPAPQTTEEYYLDKIKNEINGKADLDSPEFTGIPTAPTAMADTNTTQIATTAFVQAALATIVDGNEVSY